MITDQSETLLLYPPDAMESFLVCSPYALKLMTDLVVAGIDEKKMRQSGFYRSLIRSHASVLWRLKKNLIKYPDEVHGVLQDLQMKIGVKIIPRISVGAHLVEELELREEDFIAMGDEELLFGVQVADRKLVAWEAAAIAGFLETDLEYTVKRITYGSIEHEVWSRFVQD